MIQEKTSLWDIDRSFDFEERDRMVGAVLTVETEQLLLEHARELREQIMNIPMDAPPEQLRIAARMMDYNRGQYDFILQLVEASKGVKNAADTTDNSPL